jgi:hypothetical protein
MVRDRDGKRVLATVPGASAGESRERPITATLWRYLGYFARIRERTDCVGVNYWGGEIRMDKKLAPHRRHVSNFGSPVTCSRTGNPWLELRG